MAGSAAQVGATEDLASLRSRLLREAARVSSATHETPAEVIQRASKGVLSLATLKSLGESEVAAAHEHQKDVQNLEPDRRHGQEVHRNKTVQDIAEVAFEHRRTSAAYVPFAVPSDDLFRLVLARTTAQRMGLIDRRL